MTSEESLIESYTLWKDEIDERLKTFENKSKEDVKLEMVFCLCTPQSKAVKCWNAVLELRETSRNIIIDAENVLKKNNVRFCRKKAEYIRKAINEFECFYMWLLAALINAETREDIIYVRNCIAKDIKGYGMKEASHFLRNIGYGDLAILDRHILNVMRELGIVVTGKYLEDERSLFEFSERVGIPMEYLDLVFWKLKTGYIFK